jgi:hypothetical protein
VRSIARLRHNLFLLWLRVFRPAVYREREALLNALVDSIQPPILRKTNPNGLMYDWRLDGPETRSD